MSMHTLRSQWDIPSAKPFASSSFHSRVQPSAPKSSASLDGGGAAAPLPNLFTPLLSLLDHKKLDQHDLPTTTIFSSTPSASPPPQPLPSNATATSDPQPSAPPPPSATTATPTTICGPSASASNLWLNRINFMIKHYTKQTDVETRRLHVGSRIDKTLGSNTAHSLCTGDLRLKRIQRTLDNLGIIRSDDQIKFHDGFIQAALPHIYGDEWNANSVRVMKEFAIKEIRYECLVMTPRRWGKTWSVAIFVLSMLINKPGIRICVFSTGKRASGSLMQIVLEFLVTQIEGGEDRIIRQNQEELFLAPPNSGAKTSKRTSFTKVAEFGSNRVSKLYSYPSSETGNTTTNSFFLSYFKLKQQAGALTPPGNVFKVLDFNKRNRKVTNTAQ